MSVDVVVVMHGLPCSTECEPNVFGIFLRILDRGTNKSIISRCIRWKQATKARENGTGIQVSVYYWRLNRIIADQQQY